jgi:hypothetical protein
MSVYDMNFLEAFDELDELNEAPGKGSNGGQKTYKDFLIFLAQFLGCEVPAEYNEKWVLHHRDCNHYNNKQFTNLVLMEPANHISLHVQLRLDSKKDAWDFLEEGTTKNGEKFKYWLIGEQIDARINKIQTEPEISQFANQI